MVNDSATAINTPTAVLQTSEYHVQYGGRTYLVRSATMIGKPRHYVKDFLSGKETDFTDDIIGDTTAALDAVKVALEGGLLD